MEGMALDEGQPATDAAGVASPAMQAGGEADVGTTPMDAEGPGAAEGPADGGNASAGSGGGDDDGRPWVQCDACGKWRRLPGVTEATVRTQLQRWGGAPGRWHRAGLHSQPPVQHTSCAPRLGGLMRRAGLLGVRQPGRRRQLRRPLRLLQRDRRLQVQGGGRRGGGGLGHRRAARAPAL